MNNQEVDGTKILPSTLDSPTTFRRHGDLCEQPVHSTRGTATCRARRAISLLLGTNGLPWAKNRILAGSVGASSVGATHLCVFCISV